MRSFFKSRGFRVIAVVVAVLLVITGVSSAVGKHMSPQSSLLGAIVVPFQRAGAAISGRISDVFNAMARADTLETENNGLREEIRSLQSDLIDYDACKSENDFLNNFLDLKKEHPDFTFAPATVLSTDAAGGYGTFTIDCGTADGVSKNDPVISQDGLVGRIAEAGLTTSTVVTLLDASVNVSALDSRTRETGVLEGDAALGKSGLCRLSYLNRISSVSLGDYVVTSGVGGVYPQGLMIGTIAELHQASDELSLYAVIQPNVDFSTLRDVMVLTSFSGQGGLS